MRDELLIKILEGGSDKHIRFEDLRRLLKDLGFQERIKGSHHIFSREGVREIVNLQPRGQMAKPYQVRQVRSIIVQHRLAGGQ